MTPHFDAKSEVAMLIVKSHVEYPIIFYTYIGCLRCVVRQIFEVLIY